MDLPVQITKDRSTKGQGFNQTRHPSDLNDISDPILILEKDEKAVDHVANQALSSEADGHGPDPRSGQQRPQLDPKLSQNHQSSRQEQNDQKGMAEDISKGLGPLLGFHREKGILLRDESLEPTGDPFGHLGKDKEGKENPKNLDSGV